MIDINELRTLVQEATPGPWEVSEDNRHPGVYAGEEAVFGGSFCDYLEPSDKDQAFIAAANPAAITELLDRLEATETELAELRSSMKFRTSLIGRTEAERDTLRAKIEAMERQEPVAKVESWTNGSYTRHYKLKWLRDVGEGAALYALPGAQHAPSINEGVRKVTLGFRWESEAQHHIPTIEIEFDPVSPNSPNDAKGWQDRDRIASMLSPESKP